MVERKEKIKNYLEKRKNRNWKKRINYDCRKKVADNRIRLKGRFVTKEQAKLLEKKKTRKSEGCRNKGK